MSDSKKKLKIDDSKENKVNISENSLVIENNEEKPGISYEIIGTPGNK